MERSAEYIIEEMKKYNFKLNSVKSFAKHYEVSESYIHKKIRELNLPYNYRIKVFRNKDNFGRFTFKESVDCKKIKDSDNINKYSISNFVKVKNIPFLPKVLPK